jgi:predicted RecA/RadA family phage recombinase
MQYGASPKVVTPLTNLHSLADGAYWQSPSEDNNTDLAESLDIFVTIITTTTAGSATGYCDIFLAASVDGATDFSGNASGSEGAYAPAPGADEHSKNLLFLGRLACKADETTARTYRGQFTQSGLFKIPKDYSIVIVNRTGASLAASGNLVEILKNKVS